MNELSSLGNSDKKHSNLSVVILYIKIIGLSVTIYRSKYLPLKNTLNQVIFYVHFTIQ